jgi:hypothetical protein
MDIETEATEHDADGIRLAWCLAVQSAEDRAKGELTPCEVLALRRRGA